MSEGKWVVLTRYSHAIHYGWDDGSKFLNPERPYYTMTATVKHGGGARNGIRVRMPVPGFIPGGS